MTWMDFVIVFVVSACLSFDISVCCACVCVCVCRWQSCDLSALDCNEVSVPSSLHHRPDSDLVSLCWWKQWTANLVLYVDKNMEVM